jgi:biotin synthase
MDISGILMNENFTKEDLVALLDARGQEAEHLYATAARVRDENAGNKVFMRGLIELSNICSKNCFYCGVRSGNRKVVRYTAGQDEVLEAARFAWKNGFGSIVLQAGERSDKAFVGYITKLIKTIHAETNSEMHITLSLGEQSDRTYREWLEAGAHRYLLRMETTNRALYARLHPEDGRHDYDKRLACLHALKEIGFQTGTGVMIGLPFQTLEDLADDLLFFRNLSIDMAGMGPYIEHRDTPLYEYRQLLLSLEDRLELSLKMVALLRIMMKDVNIAATTAMQAISPEGRTRALKAGANVLMPNLTPLKYREQYLLYDNKPGLKQDPEDATSSLERQVVEAGMVVGYGEWGDPRHYYARKNN